jgi:hypothetical protein
MKDPDIEVWEKDMAEAQIVNQNPNRLANYIVPRAHPTDFRATVDGISAWWRRIDNDRVQAYRDFGYYVHHAVNTNEYYIATQEEGIL